jgi:hypothetical protein
MLLSRGVAVLSNSARGVEKKTWRRREKFSRYLHANANENENFCHAHRGLAFTTHDDIKAITARNPLLREVLLNEATALTDKAISHILKTCPSIVKIKVTGTGADYGGVRGNFAGLCNTADNLSRWSDLQAIHLDDQSLGEGLIKGVSRKRSTLLITNGETVTGALADYLEKEDGTFLATVWRGGKVEGTNG